MWWIISSVLFFPSLTKGLCFVLALFFFLLHGVGVSKEEAAKRTFVILCVIRRAGIQLAFAGLASFTSMLSDVHTPILTTLFYFGNTYKARIMVLRL